MKKLFTLLCCAAFCAVLSAQDIIVTAKAERIEALITEVSPTEIRYKKWSFQDGPTFVIGVSDLSAIIFKNGEVQVFNKKETAQTAQTTTQQMPTVRSTPATTTTQQTPYNPSAESKKSVFNASTSDEALGYIYRDDGEFVFQGRYISAKEYVRILEKNCPVAYQKYKKAERCAIAGAVFTGIGGGCLIGGLCMLGTSPEASIALDVVSIVTCSVAIPLLVVGLKNERKSIDTYNENCASQLALSLNLNQTGVGLALNF